MCRFNSLVLKPAPEPCFFMDGTRYVLNPVVLFVVLLGTHSCLPLFFLFTCLCYVSACMCTYPRAAVACHASSTLWHKVWSGDCSFSPCCLLKWCSCCE